MSVAVARELWDRAPLSKNHLLVAIALADFANGDRQAWPSIPNLADRCRCSADSVRRALAAMEDTKVITRHERSGRSTIYEFNPVDIWANPPRKCEGSSMDHPSGKCEGSEPPDPSENCEGLGIDDPSGNCDPSQSATPRTGAADPSHRCDPHFVEPPGTTPPTEVTAPPSNAAQQLDVGIPMSKAEDEPSYAATVARWALAHGRSRPTTPDRAQRYRWVLDVIAVELPEGPARNERTRRVMCDYVAEMYDAPPGIDQVKILGVLLKTMPHGAVFDALVEGVERGVGLTTPQDGDMGPLALVRYTRGVLNGRRGDAA